ncbi:MAG: anthranilate phosphoribosyltransferase [Planctomycetaceae bacterium]|jgi:anthranilate phosphoribosyltransferase|nr:anthranilate phosphoribosyltransferase [Planctomycetaceae bacterium]
MGELSFVERCRFALSRLVCREDLSADEVEGLFGAIFSDSSSDLTVEESVLLSGFLVALISKGVTVQELLGAARSLRHHARRIQVIGSPVIDIVGTGGDSLHTINVSTTSAFVLAGAGVVVAKHGNRAVSSRSGSADVLEACGVNLGLLPERVEELVAEIGIGFLFAQQFHPAMRKVASLRKYLGFRTLFNLLGPLTNPAGAGCVLLGVYDPRLTEVFASVSRELGCKRAMVVYGYDGMDELTLTTRSRVTQFFDGQFKTYDFFPELYFNGELSKMDELRGGDAKENAVILRGILSGEIKGGRRNIVLLNSAAALVCAERVKSIEEGIKTAAESIDSGNALEKLQLMIKKSNQL